MEEKDVVLAKIAIVRNCLRSIEKATNGNPASLDDQLIQDSYVLSLQRAIQACVDMAHAMIAENGWMMPSSYKMAFQILAKEGAIQTATSQKMQKMVGFRNIAVHDYQQLDVNILKSILTKHLGDLEEYCQEVFRSLK